MTDIIAIGTRVITRTDTGLEPFDQNKTFEVVEVSPETSVLVHVRLVCKDNTLGKRVHSFNRGHLKLA